MAVGLRYALRKLRSTPWVTASAMACLAIGVWMTCIVAAVARGFFFPNLHVADADRIVQMEERGLFSLDPKACCANESAKSVVDSLAASRLFAAVGYYSQPTVFVEADAGSRPATVLSAGMMGVLRPRPELGRGFVPADDTTGLAVMLSHEYWLGRYGADSTVIGRSIALRGEASPRTIVGVMPAGFMFPRNHRADLYLSPRRRPGLAAYPAVLMLGRLADGVDIDAARQLARGIAVRNVRADRDAFRARWQAFFRTGLEPKLPTGGIDFRLERYRNEPVSSQTTRFLLLIFACGFAVVGVAAANVVNLILMRGTARRQEIAVRMALGASRARVIGELLMETGLLSVGGIALGFLAAVWQWQRIDPGFTARHLLGEMDAPIAIVALGAGLLLTLLVGIWPGVRATAMTLEQVLRDAKRSGMGSSALDGILGRLVAGSTAATVMLLICAALLGLSAREATTGGVRLDPRVVETPITFDDRLSPRDRAGVMRDALARIRALPGVQSAILGEVPPYGASQLLFVTPEGSARAQTYSVEMYPVSDRFFSTMSIPLAHGRVIDASDTRDSSGSVVINRGLAAKLFPREPANGRRMRIRQGDSSVIDATVVGVVEDVRGPGGARLQLYLPFSSAPAYQTSVFTVLKGASSPDGVRATLQSVSGVRPGAPRTLAEIFRAREPQRHYVMLGFALFAIVALVLAATGTYAVVAYSVERRTHEIGVRVALGADRQRITRMVLAQGLKLTLLGVFGGLVLSAAATKLLAAFFQDVDAGYPAAIAAVVVLVSVISLMASAIPGYRAGRLDPVDALRAD